MDVVFLKSALRDFKGMSRYVGLTYPRLFQNRLARAVWRRFLCPRKMHLFDECASSEHTLECDACELRVHIVLVETSKEACARAKRSCYIEAVAVEKSESDPGHFKIVA